MRVWELTGFPRVKIRREHWAKDNFIYCDEILGWINNIGQRCPNMVIPVLKHDDWELYQEPKQTRKVTLWRPIYVNRDVGRYYTGMGWESSKEIWEDKADIVGWQSMEVEVEG